MTIGDSRFSHQDRILGAQLVSTRIACQMNRDGSVPDRGSARYRALRYELQSEGLRAVLRKRLKKA